MLNKFINSHANYLTLLVHYKFNNSNRTFIYKINIGSILSNQINGKLNS